MWKTTVVTGVYLRNMICMSAANSSNSSILWDSNSESDSRNREIVTRHAGCDIADYSQMMHSPSQQATWPVEHALGLWFAFWRPCGIRFQIAKLLIMHHKHTLHNGLRNGDGRRMKLTRGGLRQRTCSNESGRAGRLGWLDEHARCDWSAACPVASGTRRPKIRGRWIEWHPAL